MASRHAAALAVVGWYLLSPLPRADPKPGVVSGVLVDADRPLAEWKVTKTFPTGGECQVYLKNWIIEQQLAAEKLRDSAPKQSLLELNIRSNSVCIDGDDSRLKPK